MKLWAKIAAVTAVYAITGRLAVLLAIPPGYSTAVWPAAGFALAGMLIFGDRVWIGVFIGSLLTNISTSWDPSSAATIAKSFQLATGIAVGATLQAWIGARLIRDYIKIPTDLAQEKDVIKFVFLGLASCLISSTLGIATLLSAQVLTISNAPFSWFNWWVGDVIGVLIFTPVTLLLIAKTSVVNLYRKLSVSIPMVTMFVAVVLFFLFFSSQESRNNGVEFEHRTDQQVQEIRKRFDSYLNSLFALQIFFESSKNVDPSEFHMFVKNLLEHNSGLSALSWNQRVLRSERQKFENKMRQTGYDNFSIREWGSSEPMSKDIDYVVTTYIEPKEQNQRALGFNIMTIPNRHEALTRARDTGAPSATGRLQFIQEINQTYGFIVFAPIYKNGLAHLNLEERRASLLGYVAGVFRINDMLQSILQNTDRKGIEISIRDDSATGADQLFYPQFYAPKQPVTYQLERDVPIDIAGRQWIVHFALTSDYLLAHKSAQAWSFLLGAMTFTGLFGILLLIMTGRTSAVESLVRERTSELQKVNAILRDEIIERKGAERNALEALQVKSTFTSMVSHELRTPLTAVKESVEIVQDGTAGPISAEQKTFLATATRNVERLARLINDVLDFQKLTSGSQGAAINKAENDINEVVSNTVNDFLLFAKKSGLELAAELTTDLPVLHFDKDKITQVLTNLLSNAIKFTDKGKIVISTRKTNRSVRVSVQDQGIGVREEDLHKLFQVFSQIDIGVSRKTGSTGLGLAISKEIIEAHSGEIGVESVYGQGSIFYFTLPIDQNWNT